MRRLGHRAGGRAKVRISPLHSEALDPDQGAESALNEGHYSIRDQNLCLNRPGPTPGPPPRAVKLVSGPQSPTLLRSSPRPCCWTRSLTANLAGPWVPWAPPHPCGLPGGSAPSPTVTLRFLPWLGPEGTFPVHTSFPGSAQTWAQPSRCPSCPWNQLWGLGSR